MWQDFFAKAYFKFSSFILLSNYYAAACCQHFAAQMATNSILFLNFWTVFIWCRLVSQQYSFKLFTLRIIYFHFFVIPRSRSNWAVLGERETWTFSFQSYIRDTAWAEKYGVCSRLFYIFLGQFYQSVTFSGFCDSN